MSRFTDLDPANPQRLERWRQHLPHVRELLGEINADILDGRGELDENYTYSALGSTLPNLFLLYPDSENHIGVCLSTDGLSFRVLAVVDRSVWKQDTQLEELLQVLRSALNWWLDQGNAVALYTRKMSPNE